MNAYNLYIKSRLMICNMKKEINGDYSRFNSGYCEGVSCDMYMKTYISCF